MTDWMGVADMTPEEFGKLLEQMTDKVINFKKEPAGKNNRVYSSRVAGMHMNRRSRKNKWKRVGNIYPEPKRHKWARLPSPLDD